MLKQRWFVDACMGVTVGNNATDAARVAFYTYDRMSAMNGRRALDRLLY